MQKYSFLTKNGLVAILSSESTKKSSVSLEERDEKDEEVVTKLLELNNSNNNDETQSTTTETTITEKRDTSQNNGSVDEEDTDIKVDDETIEQELREMESSSDNINTGLELAESLESLRVSMESISIPDSSHSYFIKDYNKHLSNTFPGYSNSALSHSLEDTAVAISKGEVASVEKKDSVIKKIKDWIINIFKKMKELFATFFNNFKKFLSDCFSQTSRLFSVVENLQKKIDKYDSVKSFIVEKKKIKINESLVNAFKYEGDITLYDWNKLKSAEENTLEIMKGAAKTIGPSFKIRQDGITKLIEYMGADTNPTFLDMLSEMAPKYFHFHNNLKLPNARRYNQNQLNLSAPGWWWKALSQSWMKDYYEPDVLVTPLLNDGVICMLYPKRTKLYYPDDESSAKVAQLASPCLAIGHLNDFVKVKYPTTTKANDGDKEFDLLELNKLTEINKYSLELLNYVKELKSLNIDDISKSVQKMDPINHKSVFSAWVNDSAEESEKPRKYGRVKKDAFLVHGLIEGTTTFARVFSVLIRYVLAIVKANCKLIKCHLSEYSDMIEVK